MGVPSRAPNFRGWTRKVRRPFLRVESHTKETPDTRGATEASRQDKRGRQATDTSGRAAGDRVSPPAKNQRLEKPSEAKRLRPGTPFGSLSQPDTKDGAELSAAPNATELGAGDGCPPSSSTTGCPTVVARRVDALVLAFKVNPPDRMRDELREHQAIADLAGAAEVRIGDLAFSMTRNRRQDFFAFENADVRCAFDERAPSGWRLEVVLRATYLATHPLSAAIALAERVSAGLGITEDVRLRRFDLAADYVNFPLSRADVKRVVTTRARVDFSVLDGEERRNGPRQTRRGPPGRVEHLDAAMVVTGITIARGNPLMARIYNKTIELKLGGRDEKREIEHTAWTRGGWDGVQPVTRVEFQHRGVFLDEVKLRDPSKLETQLDAVWQHDARWLRLVDPSTATRRSRCNLDPRWAAVVATRFLHHAAPVSRARSRGGAKPELILRSP